MGVLTGVGAWSFFLAATWSSIHGGMSQMLLAVISRVAIAVPPVCGFLVGCAVYRWQPRRPAAHRPLAMRLSCPHCGCSMKPSAEYAATPPYNVVECPIHGPFHVSANTDLTLGRPPQP